MGQATDASKVLANALSSGEMSERSEQARSFSSPEATPSGEVRERQQPQAAPVYSAPSEGWD